MKYFILSILIICLFVIGRAERHIALVDGAEYDICNANIQPNETVVYTLNGLYHYTPGDSLLYRESNGNLSRTIIYKMGEPICGLAGDGDDCVVAFGQQICLISNDILIPVAKLDDLITAFAFSPDGYLFYGTGKELGYIDAADRRIKLSDTGVRNLTLDKNVLYVIYTDGSVGIFRNINLYKSFADDFTDENIDNE